VDTLTSGGRLLALLAASTRDLAAAEDALADAFERALRTWPSQGVPTTPDAWPGRAYPGAAWLVTAVA
jgi:predicted RNA polymerase sigma factor